MVNKGKGLTGIQETPKNMGVRMNVPKYHPKIRHVRLRKGTSQFLTFICCHSSFKLSLAMAFMSSTIMPYKEPTGRYVQPNEECSTVTGIRMPLFFSFRFLHSMRQFILQNIISFSYLHLTATRIFL